jgi:hypothetical protein
MKHHALKRMSPRQSPQGCGAAGQGSGVRDRGSGLGKRKAGSGERKAQCNAMESEVGRRTNLLKDVVQRSAGLTKPESAKAARFRRSPHA